MNQKLEVSDVSNHLKTLFAFSFDTGNGFEFWKSALTFHSINSRHVSFEFRPKEFIELIVNSRLDSQVCFWWKTAENGTSIAN